MEHFLDHFCLEPDRFGYRRMLLHTVFTDEWKNPNKWQVEMLQEWRKAILDEAPVLDIRF